MVTDQMGVSYVDCVIRSIYHTKYIQNLLIIYCSQKVLLLFRFYYIVYSDKPKHALVFFIFRKNMTDVEKYEIVYPPIRKSVHGRIV